MSGESKKEKKPKALSEPVEVSRERDEALAQRVRAMYPIVKQLEAEESVAEERGAPDS